MPPQRLLPILAILLLLGGCTSVVQQGALHNARQAMAERKFAVALRELSQAERYAPPTPETKVEIVFLQATSYEGLERPADASGLYRYIIATFPESPYANQAKMRLGAMTNPQPDPPPRPTPSVPNVRLGKEEFPAVVPASSTTASGKPPKPLRIVNPSYPKELDAKGVAGVVMLRFVVGTDGRVHQITVVSSPDPLLSSAAKNAINAWQFQPGEKDGRKVECTLEVPITFEAREK